MPFVVRLQSLIEARLQGFASPELTSILAEMLVAALLIGPLIGLFAFAGWLVKRNKPAHSRS